MPINELVLNGPIESFQVAVGLRMSGVIEEVNQAAFPAIVIEMFFEFAAVIGLDPCSSEWSDSDELVEEIRAVSRGIRFIGTGESEPGFNIDSGKDIAFDAVDEDRDGIHLDDITWKLRKEAFPSRFLPDMSGLSYQQPAGSAA